MTSYSPRSGLHGTNLRVQIRLSYDLGTIPGLSFSITFGRMRSPATVKKFDGGDEYHHYALDTEIPTFDPSQSQSPGTQVPLYLNMEDEFGQSLGVVEVGDFTFGYPSGYQYPSGPATATTRKRKQSAEPSEYLRSPPKRSASQQMMERMRAPSSGYPALQSQMSPYARAASSGTYGLQPPMPAQPMYAQRGGQEPSYQYSLMPYAQQEMQSPGMLSSMYGQAGRSSSISAPPPAAPTTMAIAVPSTTSSSAPTLVRTSSMQPSTAPLSQPAPSGAQPFNPYAMYPNSKAVLKIEGDLDKMAVEWNEDEWEAKRRLVQFQRSQTGSSIHATFEAVSPEERRPNSICISCIWWEERGECFVTSVDAIYLLESLVAVRFTVEEKNRIRRNLEGFRPLTVSKQKADSEEFFKVIMGFPNPKPRNIEKDVKVFPWKILAHALKKIIGKYVSSPSCSPIAAAYVRLTMQQSASYSSTAGALLTPAAPSYTSGGHTSSSEPATEQHVTASPGSSSSAPTSHRASSMTTTARSPNIPMAVQRTTSHDTRAPLVNQAGAQVRGMHQEQLRGPHGLPGYDQPDAWSQVPQYSSVLGTTTGRPSWDTPAYIGNASPPAVTAMLGSAQQPHQYYRNPSTSSTGQGQAQNNGGLSYDMYGGAGSSGDGRQTSHA